MEAINVHDAKTHFSKLIERVSKGEEITIAKAGRPVAMLVPLPPRVDRRIAGTARGTVQIGSDFDEPLPEEVLGSFAS